jgi:hypothetical protein
MKSQNNVLKHSKDSEKGVVVVVVASREGTIATPPRVDSTTLRQINDSASLIPQMRNSKEF